MAAGTQNCHWALEAWASLDRCETCLGHAQEYKHTVQRVQCVTGVGMCRMARNHSRAPSQSFGHMEVGSPMSFWLMGVHVP